MMNVCLEQLFSWYGTGHSYNLILLLLKNICRQFNSQSKSGSNPVHDFFYISSVHNYWRICNLIDNKEGPYIFHSERFDWVCKNSKMQQSLTRKYRYYLHYSYFTTVHTYEYHSVHEILQFLIQQLRSIQCTLK